MMPKIIREVDHVVLLPRCSRHALAGATLGMKAAVGYWRTDSRLEYHHDAATFHEKTAEANTVTSLKEKQRLTLTVADKIQATFGPDKGCFESTRFRITFFVNFRDGIDFAMPFTPMLQDWGFPFGRVELCRKIKHARRTLFNL